MREGSVLTQGRWGAAKTPAVLPGSRPAHTSPSRRELTGKRRAHTRLARRCSYLLSGARASTASQRLAVFLSHSFRRFSGIFFSLF